MSIGKALLFLHGFRIMSIYPYKQGEREAKSKIVTF